MPIPVLKLNLAPRPSLWRQKHLALGWAAIAVGSLGLVGALATWGLRAHQARKAGAQAILISPDRSHLDAVEARLRASLPSLERAEIVRASLARRGALIEVRDLEEAACLANRIAPEHLELSVADPEALAGRIRHAGAIFLGRHTAEALGDYCAGPNHVLPTSGTARFSSPLGVYDFQKRSSLIFCSPEGADTLARTASVLARGEGLTAHARSAECRRQDPP